MYTIKIICVSCNKEFEASYPKKPTRCRKTCGYKCHQKLMSKIQSEPHNRTCKNCGKGFIVRKHKITGGGGKYCSKSCFYTHRKKTTKYITVTCIQCNKSFDVQEKRVLFYKNKYGDGVFRYCSRKCCLSSQNKTSIEMIIEDILIKNNIDYEYNKHVLDNFVYDFRLLKYKILIECDGAYWHSRERDIDTFVDNRDHKANSKDLRKSLAAIKNSYILLRFKEYDLYRHSDIIEQMILETIKQVEMTHLLSSSPCDHIEQCSHTQTN